MQKMTLNTKEDDDQEALMEWVTYQAGKWPELELIYHVPNEGKRSQAYARRLKRMGLKSGVPDVCLPVARGGYHGLYIELKRGTGHGRLSASQKIWLEALGKQGYRAVCCKGWVEAACEITAYMKGDGRNGREEKQDGERA